MMAEQPDGSPDPRRGLPQVDRMSTRVAATTGADHALVRRIVRDRLDRARVQASGSDPTPDQRSLEHEVAVVVRSRMPMRKVLNATGVLLHTNLGRAPMAGDQGHVDLDAAPVDLEYDLVNGRRGNRLSGLEASLAAFTGAESALVVNNNAAAVLLAVSALAAGRDVLVSRGELVEIGGSFRVPEVISQGGARLVEVGTTNRTHDQDYLTAMGDRTAAVLQVHPSNYRVEGFTAAVSTEALARIADGADVPLVLDLGGGLPDTRCGWLAGGPPGWLAGEPGVSQSLAAGAHVVTFSGDKLLGGPQAGIIVGHARYLKQMRRHPLARALRFDRTRAVRLQSTVDSYLDGTAGDAVPLWRMASVPSETLKGRCFGIVNSLGNPSAHGVRVTVREASGTMGAGAATGCSIPGFAVVIETPSGARRLADKLRTGATPVVGGVLDGGTWLHLRTVDPFDDKLLAAALSDALDCVSRPDP